jgi:glucose/arabinose dehydrogenase
MVPAILLVAISLPHVAVAQQPEPSMLHPRLDVRKFVSGLITPTTMAFIDENDILVLEKNTGKVRRVINGVLQQNSVLQLPVNFFSERGLLGIALHPDFEDSGFVYLYWTESSTGTVTGNPADVLLLGNRVDRFIWNGSTLTFDKNLIKLRAFQADEGQPLRGNHNGGRIVFEPKQNDDRRADKDRQHENEKERRKLFILIGDNGRRGWMQNVTIGTSRDGIHDDQFGGPEPDNAHLTGVILRLNDDGTTPKDNPFFKAGAETGAEVGANIQKVFAYGVRNSFGLAVDPLSGTLWDEENGSDSFDEINRVDAGANNGWVQIMGPVERIRDYKSIEIASGARLQQRRWPPELIADTPQAALDRLFVLPGSHYNDPKFSWKFELPSAAIGFVKGERLGDEFDGDLFVGAATPRTVGGYLLHFKLTADREDIDLTASGLSGRVAENLQKDDLHGSESLLIGRDFGIGTDIVTGPNGNLFVVSLTKGAIYEIFRRPE